MNSPNGNLFLALQALIASLEDEDGNKYFKYVDQDLGQLESHNGDMRPPVLWPCVLIDIDRATYSQFTENVQEGDGQIILRLGFPPFSSTAGGTPTQYKEKALNYYDLEQVLYLALQGKRPGNVTGYEDLQDVFGPLIRTSAGTERRTDIIRVRAITYSITHSDYSAEDTRTFTPVTLSITDEITV